MLLDTKPLNFATIGYVLGIEPKTIYCWYRNHLSSFKEEVSSGEFHKYDLKHSDGTELSVPILKPENVDESMVIDEKMINDEMYTILSNKKTGKIALLAETTEFKQLTQLAEHFGDKLLEVRFINSDMDPVYKKFCKTVFPGALLTIDKFHIISSVIECLQAVRIRLKSQWMAKLPKKGKKSDVHSKVDINLIEDKLKMLRRCRNLLFKKSQDWKPWQHQKAMLLFAEFPELSIGHKLLEKLRFWYDKAREGKSFLHIDNGLIQWIEDVEIANIPEMIGLSKMFNKHYDNIFNYYFTNQTNAIAENINSRIQRFINVNYGVRDQDFFFFRLKNYYS